MSQLEKQLEKLFSLPREMRYEEIKALLERFGFIGIETGSGSSHITYRKNGYPNITIPRHGNIKRVYLKLVKNVIMEVIKDEQ